ncbi:MAG TPA: tripartite tricarboxylate transporter substrate binding protein [Burkholderiales bacterium]|nr:tripartite tricarboxylate transporter substrate binding protein [Burkholderiales bacterium]
MSPGSGIFTLAAALALLSAALAPAPASAQSYPSRPVRVIVPFAPGGGSDILARLLGQKLQQRLKQPFIVENRAGGGGNIGAELGAKAAPDGYTLLVTTAALAVNVSLVAKLGFDPAKDLIPITQIASAPLVLVIHPSVPARTVAELVQVSRKRPGGINFGSNGSGSTSHLSGVLFNQMAGIQLTHVPYKGGASAMTAVLRGEVDMGFIALFVGQAQIRSGRLRPLAVTTVKPSAALPGVPTMASFFRGFETDNWFALFAPAGTPPEIIATLYAEFVRALELPDVTELLARDGAVPVGSSPREFTDFFAREVEKYAKLVRESGARAE